MNRLQLPPALKDKSSDSNGKVVFSGADSITKGAHGSADSTGTWLLIVTGFLSAAFTADLLCRLPLLHPLSWTTLFLRSAVYIALTAEAGALGMWILWFFLRTKTRAKPSFGMAFLSKKLGIGCVFLPCITLLYRRGSPWMLLVLTVATVAVVLSLRRLFPVSVESDQRKLPNDLPALYGLPIAAFRPLREVFIALCAQAALVFVITGSLFLAGILLSTSLSLLVWRWIALDSRTTTRFTGRRPHIALGAFALFLTMFLLIPPSDSQLHSTFGLNHLPRKPPSLAQPADKPSSEYVGIVLWPPPVKKEIIPPFPRDHSFAIGSAAKPVVIPFDGPYWYFKAPSKRPGPHAHIAHGKPTDVTVRSSDWAPLLMEAHQNLGSSIDLACCSEIDVAITNADTRPGKIALGIVLTDSNSTGKPWRTLGEQTIVSSAADQIPMNRPPVKEILRFPISRSATMRGFNEITIIFLPAKERARGGAKVSIQSFTLIPR
jgi:hypothetical protein